MGNRDSGMDGVRDWAPLEWIAPTYPAYTRSVTDVFSTGGSAESPHGAVWAHDCLDAAPRNLAAGFVKRILLRSPTPPTSAAFPPHVYTSC